MCTVKLFENVAHNRRVIIYRRADGTYGFTEETWSDDPHELCWIPQDTGSICDSEATAIREAQGRISWLHGD